MFDFITVSKFPIEFIIIVPDEKNTGAENNRLSSVTTETFLSEQPIQLIPPGKLKGGVMVREIFAHLSYGSSPRHICWDLWIDASAFGNALTVISDWENQRGIRLN